MCILISGKIGNEKIDLLGCCQYLALFLKELIAGNFKSKAQKPFSNFYGQRIN
jgi:hypothetical protein